MAEVTPINFADPSGLSNTWVNCPANRNRGMSIEDCAALTLRDSGIAGLYELGQANPLAVSQLFSPQGPDPEPEPEPGPFPTNLPVWTWTLEVGYTPVFAGFDHLFLWLHPTQDPYATGNSVVFDGGPAHTCSLNSGCGNVSTWASPLGHYQELTNPRRTLFFSTTFSAEQGGRVGGGIILSMLAISSASIPYSPFGPNSNSVVYSVLNAALPGLGLSADSIGIQTVYLPPQAGLPYSRIGVYGSAFFTGWGQQIP